MVSRNVLEVPIKIFRRLLSSFFPVSVPLFPHSSCERVAPHHAWCSCFQPQVNLVGLPISFEFYNASDNEERGERYWTPFLWEETSCTNS